MFAEYAGRGSTTKPVLVGVSEGAGLSVLAATDPRTRGAIGGVVGLGLPDLNELGWRWRDALIYLTHGTPNEPLFSAAHLAAQVAPLPLAAIHATHDEFVPLADVQRIVSAAREPKRLWIVEAADHRFSDNLPEFDRRLAEALAWIANPHAPRRDAGHEADRPGRTRADARRIRHALPALISLLVFLIALAVLRIELHAVRWRDLQATAFATPRPRLLLAVALTALNYAVLTGYDLLAFASIGRELSRRRIAAASFVAYAIAQQRRLRGALGRLGPLPLLLALGRHRRGAVAHRRLLLGDLLAGPAGARRREPRARHRCRTRPSCRRRCVTRAIGWLLVAVVVAYVVACVVRRAPLRVGRCSVPLPPSRARAGAAGALRRRLGARRLGALRAAAGRGAAVPRVARRVSRVAASSAWPATCLAASACSKD